MGFHGYQDNYEYLRSLLAWPTLKTKLVRVVKHRYFSVLIAFVEYCVIILFKNDLDPCGEG